VSEFEDDLRATTQDVAADAAELQEIEEQKAQLLSDDPRMANPKKRGPRRRPH